MERVVFGGVDLADGFAVANVKRPLPHMELEIEHVPGRDGYALKSADMLPGEITFDLIAIDADARGRRAVARELAALLLRKEPVEVSFSSDDGLYYRAIASDAIDFDEYVRCGKAGVRLQPLDAAMYGAVRTVTVPSGGSVEFTVGGTYPTRPVISATATRDAITHLWGVQLDDLEFVHLDTLTDSPRDVEIDCAARTCSVAGTARMVTIDSDWLELAPGDHVLEMDHGTGDATVTFTERWL